ncbi:AIDA repeat-containing protein, partial [Pantoea ananatis]
ASEKAASGGRPPLAVKKAAAALLLLGVTGSALATDYSGSTVSAGQVQKVNPGDRADGVSEYGLQSVNSGAFKKATTVYYGGQQYTNNGGEEVGSTVYGYQCINSGGESSRIKVNSGGQLAINSGGILDGTTTLTDGAMLTDLGRQQGASVINRGILKFSQ